MYIFGVDLPLVEVLLAVGIIGVIILIEITIILVFISYHMKNSKKLETQIGNLTKALMKLENKELKELEKIENIEKEEKGIIKQLLSIRNKKKTKRKAIFTKKDEAKMLKTSKHKQTPLIKRIDNFLKRWKK